MTESLPPDEVRRILEARARALAVADTSTEAAGDAYSMIVVAAGGERCGIELSLVQEIDIVGVVTPVPGIPEFWRGIVNLRGSVYPVLDLAHHLGFGEVKRDGEARVVLVAASGMRVGLLVDDVCEIRSVPVEQVGPVVSEGLATDEDVFSGVTDDLVTLLDVQRLLASPGLVVEHEVV